MMLRVLSAALIAVGAWGAWQRHQAKSLRTDRDHWRAEARTARHAAAQAELAHVVAVGALKAEQARNRDYDEIRAAIMENDDETPVDPVVSDALRRLCARDPDCDDNPARPR